MKKRLLAISLAAGFTALMTACDETTNTDIMNADAAATVDSLPKCDKSYDGMLATIPSKGEILICTQGEWENVAKTIGSSTPGSNDGSTAGCTAKTLSDGDGVQIICDGKKVATLKNGEKGEQGETGSAGSPGTKGGNGSPGSNGSSGKDFKLSADDCVIHRMVGDLVIYNCGDSTYQEALSTANVKTWNALDFKTAFTNKSGSSIGSFETAHLPSASANPGEGKLERWDEDTWTGSAALTAGELQKNFAIKGKATLTVEEGVKPYNGVLEPSVGVNLAFSTNPNIYSWGGVCVTYTSEKPMELILTNDGLEVARAPLAAAAKETTVNIVPNQFKADSQDVKLEDILKSPQAIFIKAVGSLTPGDYENTFAVYELGAYKQCSGETVEDVEAWAKTIVKAAEPLVDDRADPENPVTYKTVTIGEQTWMAENLRLPYPSKTDDGDGDPETDDGAPMILCPATEEDLVAKGCLYRWSAVMDSVGLYNEASVYQDEEGSDVALKHCGNGKACALTAPVKGICPDGWHVPTSEEVEVLLKTAKFDENYPGVSVAALAAEGANWLGFSAVGSGYTSNYSTTSSGSFVTWLATEASANDASYLYWNGGSTNPFQIFGDVTKTYGFAVRCIQDQANE